MFLAIITLLVPRCHTCHICIDNKCHTNLIDKLPTYEMNFWGMWFPLCCLIDLGPPNHCDPITFDHAVYLIIYFNFKRIYYGIKSYKYHWASVPFQMILYLRKAILNSIWCIIQKWWSSADTQIWNSQQHIMTSSNGNIFRVTGYLCGEFTGHRWIPRTKASDAELWCFLWYAPELTIK